ncbi:MAG: BamA/TamA family outer membrane protein [Leptospiraceae bacterium]|nr:BamA/TamA family outer membrane protein [Leptospiraceae bacterium]
MTRIIKQWILILCAGFILQASLTAQEELTKEQKEALFEEALQKGPPTGMENKRMLSKKDYVNKKEGGYFTGLPLFNVDADTGVGYGARILYFQNGDREDEKFAYTPYQYRLFGQYFATTGGFTFHWVDLDAPYIMGSLFRLRTGFVWDTNSAWRYFGSSAAQTQAAPSVINNGGPGAGTAMTGTFADFENVLRNNVNGQTNARYFLYGYERPRYMASIERDLFGGMVRPLVGFQVEKVTITRYQGQSVNTNQADAIQQQTLLDRDCSIGLAVGCDGGWNNMARFGIAFDRRDFEPDPNNGVFADTVFEMANKALGSAYNFQRYTAVFRGYYSPIEEIADVVLAGRLLYSYSWGNVPFWELNKFSQTTGRQDGLGGNRSMRGFTVNRFTGPIMTMANFEIRYTFADVDLGSQHFAFMIVPFVDIARTFDANADLQLKGFRYSYGAGLRIPWNQATVIYFDYGLSNEGSGLYINFDHIF